MSHYNDRRYKFVNTRRSDRSGVRNGTRRTDRSGRGARPKRMAQEAPQPNSCTAANIRLGSCRRKCTCLSGAPLQILRNQLPPKFGAKPLGRFFRRRRRVSSPVDSPNSSFLRRFPAFSLFPQQGGRACNMEARREYQAALLTPQKNGRGPCPTPVIFLCQAWYLRKNPSGA